MKFYQYRFPALLLLAITTMIGASCLGQSKLPDSWQSDMVLKMTFGGGRRYYSYEVAIKDTGSYRLVNDAGKETRTPLSFTTKELKDLISFLKDKKFDQINSKKRNGIVYDMGTTSTVLQWGNQTFGVSVGATMDIEEADKENYAAIRTYLEKLVKDK